MGTTQGQAIGGGLLLTAVATTLGCTNPDPAAFEHFATAQAMSYLKTEVCPQELPLVGKTLQPKCLELLATPAVQQQVRDIIAQNTQRDNFFLFSRYRTHLSPTDLISGLPPGLLPSYRVDSFGILQRFQIYNAEEQ